MKSFADKISRESPRSTSTQSVPVSNSWCTSRLEVQQILRSAKVQPELLIGAPNDVFEREADEVADTVMRMPGGKASSGSLVQSDRIRPKWPGEAADRELATNELPEEEEDKLVSLKADVSGEKPFCDDLNGRVRATEGGGIPLGETERAFFEPRFGADFSRVLIHCDEKAEVLAGELNAKAFTIGHTIFFGKNQYQPETHMGRRLMAHELTHVLQQSQALSAVQVQRHCGGPEGEFNFPASQVGQRIIAGLGTVTETIPSELPGGQPTTRPRINPSDVLTLLATSPCFLHDAQQVEWLYFGRPRRGGGTTPPRRSPPLTFDFHEVPARGSHFRRRESEIRIHTTTMADVVQSIVHEVVHASHAAPGPRGRGGSVTRRERGMVREESQTRVRENEIMDQIVATPLWQPLTGQVGFTRAEEAESEVRPSTTSGLPMLNYQEYFIIEQMLDETRPAGVNESLTREVVLTLYSSMRSVSPENADSFRVSGGDIRQYQRQGAAPLPVAPPTYHEAVQCAGVFRRTLEWRRALERNDRLPDEARQQLGPACSAFIEGYPQPTGYPLSQAYGGQWNNEPAEAGERERFFINLHSLMRAAYDTVVDVRDTGRLVDRWFQSLPPASRGQGREYLEWHLICETMSREWISLGQQSTSDPVVRRRHLDFLQARIGSRLRGISRAGL